MGRVRDLLDSFDAERAAGHVAVLCSQQMAGRLPGSRGEQCAAEYLVAALTAAGFEPVSRTSGFVDPFEVLVPGLHGTPTLQVWGAKRVRAFEHLVDFSVNVQGPACGGSVEAQCVWLGAFEPAEAVPVGLPGRVAVCSGLARTVGAGLTAQLDEYLSRLRRARDAGAAALLQRAAHVDRRKVMNDRRERPGLPSLDVSQAVLEAAFGGKMPEGVGSLGLPVALRVPLRDASVLSAGNVAGQFGRGPVRLLLLAHYDHVGELPDGRWFAGAADNASGVAVVLEAARVLAETVPSDAMSLVVLLTSGEELGMLGARRFAERHVDLLDGEAVAVNVDDIGGAGSKPLCVMRAPGFPDELLGAQDGGCVGAKLRCLPLASDGFADHVPLLQAGVRRVAALCGSGTRSPVEHTLRDTADRIDPDGLRGAGRAMLLVAHRLLAQVHG